MKEITMAQAKALELDILLEFDRLCRDRGLTYYLAYGTLLGAVRHGGFIPWDDDIDVLMPRADYERLVEEFPKACAVAHYRLVSPEDPISRHSFIKIMDTRTVKIESNMDYTPGALGIDMDVFPLDGQPEGESDHRVWYEKLQRCYRMADFPVRKTYGGRKKRWPLALINFLGGKRRWLGIAIKGFWQRRALRLHRQYPYGSSSWVGMVEHCFGCEKQRYPRQLFEETTLLEFEGHLFPAPAQYDEVLRICYGDYMTPPPESERGGHLIESAYWK